MATISEALGMALQHHQAGRLQAAEQIYRQILQVAPNHADTIQFLGLLAHQVGQHEAAIEQIKRAIQLNGTAATYHNNLGGVYRAIGRVPEAVASYRRAVELQPEFSDAHYNLGNALKDDGKLDEAVGSYRRSLELNPKYPETHNNLGVTYKELGRAAESVPCFLRAIELNPNYAEAHSNLGNSYRELGKLDEAIARYRRALELKPGYAEGHSNLGNSYKDQGRLDEAIASCRRALELKPDHAEAHNTLGAALNDQGKLDEAIASYQRALQVKPDYAVAYGNLGNPLKDQGRLDEAIASYRRALELNPDFVEIHSNLLYTLIFHPGYSSADIYAEHRKWNQRFGEPLARLIQPHLNDKSPDRRLRIGYMSPDFRNHAESFFTVPLLSAHDHQNFEIVCYSDVINPDAITTRIRSYADVWKNIAGLNHDAVAQLVRDDGIDILVDLTMHMARNRQLVFARKPAPVQVCWLAYQGTTGLTAIDYRLTDAFLDPPDQPDDHYSEESVRLPDAFWVYDPLTTEPAVTPVPALTNGHITFGCLNNFCKVNADVLKLWARVLKSVPDSQLVLLTGEGSHRQHTLDVLQQAGVGPERVRFVGKLPRPQYLELCQQIDIGLDTFPYTGQTTSLDAFWLGVPVVTLVGETVVARAGLSLLENLGLPELIAHDADEYVRIAQELSEDLPRLQEFRQTLRSRLEASSLMDAPRFARNVETAYRQMWRRYCERAV